MTAVSPFVSVENLYKAKVRLNGIALNTPLQRNFNLSAEYGCNVWLKREDLQTVRSFKIRGAYNKMASVPRDVLEKGVVCASAGNHAQGVAYACAAMKVKGKIYMPTVTPSQKINKVKLFGQQYVEVILTGDTFDDSFLKAKADSETNGTVFVHPFDDDKTIEGQGAIGLEILESLTEPIDYLFVTVGGGGLIAGLGSCFKQLSPHTKIIGAEPKGAPAMQQSLRKNEIVTLHTIDSFVDGAAVKRVGERTFAIGKAVIDDMVLVSEGKVCTTILKMYNEEGIVTEPAGALGIAALDRFREEIKGKNVVCIVCGSNNDITRTEEIKERSLLHEGLKHYFVISFPQRAGALREFLNEVLGATDDITHFEYTKKHNRATGPALIGIQVKNPEDLIGIKERMTEHGIRFESLNDNPLLFGMLV